MISNILTTASHRPAQRSSNHWGLSNCYQTDLQFFAKRKETCQKKTGGMKPSGFESCLPGPHQHAESQTQSTPWPFWASGGHLLTHAVQWGGPHLAPAPEPWGGFPRIHLHPLKPTTQNSVERALDQLRQILKKSWELLLLSSKCPIRLKTIENKNLPGISPPAVN